MSQTAFHYAIRLLSVRDYSEFKLSKKLQDKGHHQEEIAKTIERLKELNYLREHEYLRIRIKQLVIKGYSNSYVQSKCYEENITASNELINDIRHENGHENTFVIEKLIEKKLRHKTIPKEFTEKQKLKAKIINFLSSKGHQLNESLPIVDKYLR